MSNEPRTLDEWLAHAEGVHRVGIDLGLERVGRVAARMGFVPPGHRPSPRSVIVAGTNGKGSTCVALEALLRDAGWRVGTTLSPHLHVFNERVRVDGRAVDDAVLCAAFARVDAARGEIPLTYFEFSALVALDCFRTAAVDVSVLEVGLGGRLDAFNLVDADVAIITSIGLDHQDYLGHDLETIGREKAGVMRPGQRVVLGRRVTESVVGTARRLDCQCTRLGVDFDVRHGTDTWDFVAARHGCEGLAFGALAPENCALALETAGHLVSTAAPTARSALAAATLPGRMECWFLGSDGTDPLLILDVAHNPAGAGFLQEQLGRRHPGRRFIAILGTLEDKDSAGVAAALAPRLRAVVCTSTGGARGLSAEALRERVAPVLAPGIALTATPDARGALTGALSSCRDGDAILTLGSFDLVERMRNLLMAGNSRPVAFGSGA